MNSYWSLLNETFKIRNHCHWYNQFYIYQHFKIIFCCFCCWCCVTVHRPVQFVLIMRWWCSNFGQGYLRTYYPSLTLQILFQRSLPTCLNRFSVSFYFPLYPTAPPSAAVCCRIFSLLQSLPIFSTGAKRRTPGCLPHPPPDSLRRSALRPALRSWVLLLFPASVCSPFAALGLHPSLYHPLRVLPLWVHPSTLCLSLSFLCSVPNIVILWVLVSCWVAVFA